ncbi:MAG TPA: cyanophycinase [Bryobacteraceae bacterium]|nr:cyanophycinase [Bryobacteraceae bacterium]
MKLGSSLVFLTAYLLASAAPAPKVGPPKGSLVIAGGGTLEPAIVDKFIELAGGKDAPFVIIPTAGEGDSFDKVWVDRQFLAKAGATNVTVLHTRDREVADSRDFVKPLRKARGVWFPGGRQWRLVDSYLYTRTHRELWKVLKRGGVIGGSSAGATIQGSYLVRGARSGNTVMMAPGYEMGMGFLRDVGVDQHLLARKRQDDMVSVVQKHPELLGIGIDERTAVIVRGDQMEVIGASKVAIYDPKRGAEPNGKRYYFLSAGDRFNLANRRRQ